MHAGVTNIQRLAAAESSCCFVEALTFAKRAHLAFRRRLTQLFRTPASCLDSLTNTQL
jgi:hypothetical protein